MKYTFILLTCLLAFTNCGTQKKATSAAGGKKTVKYKADSPNDILDGNKFIIKTVSTDSTYGYTEANPIRVGATSPANERRYLNSIYGPQGQVLKYERAGSCCDFKTPNGMLNETGLLDMYEVTYHGLEEPVLLYLDMYDYAPLAAPVGFTLKASSKI